MAESFLLGNAPLPIADAIARPRRREQFGRGQADPLEGTMSDPWVDYMSRMASTIQQAATRIRSANLLDQGASIAATDISGTALKEGLYRFSFHARVTVAAGISSELTVTLSWTDGGVAQSEASKPQAGNTTDSRIHGDILIHIDAGSPVRYETTYVSAGPPEMEYRLDVILEVVQA
jgi:hypothetical protein